MVYYCTPEAGVILYDVQKAKLTQTELASAKEYVPNFAREQSLSYCRIPGRTPAYASYALRAAAYAGAFYCGYKLCEALLGCLMVACLA